MPKVSTENSSEPKRAPRKRAPRKVVASDDAPVLRTRTVSKTSREVAEAVTPRKAPVRVLSTAPQSKNKLYVVLATIVVVFGVAAWIGISDAGKIDVTARVNEMNERAASVPSEESENNNEPQSVVVPVQDTPPVVEASNLSGRGIGTPDVSQPVPEVVPEVATSTEAVPAEEAATSLEGTVSQEAPSADTPTE